MTKLKISFVTVEFSDGLVWSIPVEIIANHRAGYYADIEEWTLEESLNNDTIPFFNEDPNNIIDWAQSNMNWGDVENYAQVIDRNKPNCDYGYEWCNADMDYVK